MIINVFIMYFLKLVRIEFSFICKIPLSKTFQFRKFVEICYKLKKNRFESASLLADILIDNNTSIINKTFF